MNEHFPDHNQLRRDLEQVLGPAPEPSAELRASLLDYAAKRAPAPAPRPQWRRPIIGALATAAVLTLLLLRPDATQVPGIRGDFNADGRVDILDAWQLSRSLDGDDSGRDTGDLDADGEITPDDLDQLMRQIVSVGGGTS